MRDSLFSMYRAVDEADLGVVSFKECMEVSFFYILFRCSKEWVSVLMKINGKS